MVSKKDPICGMKGHIKKHKHYFCSENCIEKYEIKKGIIKKKKSGIDGYVIGIAISGLVIWLVQMSGYMLWFMGGVFVILAGLKFFDL